MASQQLFWRSVAVPPGRLEVAPRVRTKIGVSGSWHCKPSSLADAATQVRWDGDMRHLPPVGAVLIPPEAVPYLVVKQDNNGTTFRHQRQRTALERRRRRTGHAGPSANDRRELTSHQP